MTCWESPPSCLYDSFKQIYGVAILQKFFIFESFSSIHFLQWHFFKCKARTRKKFRCFPPHLGAITYSEILRRSLFLLINLALCSACFTTPFFNYWEFRCNEIFGELMAKMMVIYYRKVPTRMTEDFSLPTFMDDVNSFQTSNVKTFLGKRISWTNCLLY